MMEINTEVKDPILSMRNVSVQFNGIAALTNVTFDVQKKQIISLIGPNGAGKTTLLNCLSCLYKPVSGDILYQGKSILKEPPHALAVLGINRTFQRVTLFHKMTALNNIKIGMHARTRSGFISSALRLPSVSREERDLHKAAMEIAAYFGLEKWIHTLAIDLPLIIQKRVELARALIGNPQLLLLDEPASGLSQQEVEDQKTLIYRLRDNLDVTLLIVEHNMKFVMNISDRVIVLNFGRKIAEGTPQEIQQNAEVVHAYLGEGAK